MENRKRNIQMKFYVTEEEKRLIDEKMKQLPIKQYGAYFRKMAIDGYILVVDRSAKKLTDFKGAKLTAQQGTLHYNLIKQIGRASCRERV